MKAKQNLPFGYFERFSIDIQKTKRLVPLVNLIPIAITVAMFILMNMHISFIKYFLLDFSSGANFYFFRFAIFMIAIFSYNFLPELTHGIAMKCCGCEKLKCGFRSLMFFIGSEDYFFKNSYIAISLLPPVIMQVLLIIINILVPIEWFWVVYFLQIYNVSDAVWDAYAVLKLFKLPNDVLVKDTGVSLTVYCERRQMYY